MLALLDRDREPMIQQTLIALAEAIPVYAARPDPAFVSEVAEFLRENLELFSKTAARGLVPGPDEMDMVRKTAERRVSQGVPLEQVLRAFRVSHQTLMEAMMKERRLEDPDAGVPFGLALDSLRYIDAASLELATTYVRVERQMQANVDRRRVQFLDALLEGRRPDDDLRQSLDHELPLRPGMDYLVAICRRETDSPVEELVSTISRTGASVPFAGGIGVINGDDLVAVVAIGETVADDACDRFVRAVRASEKAARSKIGVGCLAHGPEELAPAFREATLAVQRAGAGTTLSLPNLSIVDRMAVLFPSGADSSRIVDRATREFLEEDEANGGDLAATVRAYVENKFSSRKAAKELYVHPNTVLYRLRRIGESLGIDLQNAPEAIDLGLASRLLRHSWETPHPVDP